MNPERWRQIERIYNRALELGPDKREAFIEGACGDDGALRQEVERLLARQSEAEYFIESPAIEMAAQALAGDRHSEINEDLTGSTLLHYQIKGKIGAGGMGAVYRAQDTNLNRPVAIKVLPDVFAADSDRLGRFEREARLLATLSHPNVASIYGLEKLDDRSFLVLELVEGLTLEERLRKGPIAVDETLDICRQIAEGLEAAHDKGVIHRDLKPANIKLTPEGMAKILDFGLAKAFQEQTEGIDLSSQSADSLTASGAILGTVAYMSPEQARGKAVDRRSDIWAFGCVLYECLTGRRAYEGGSLTETVAAILRDEPNWAVLPESTPQKVSALLRRCLRKDPKERLRDIGDARIEIEEAMPKATTPGAAEHARTWARWNLWYAAVLVALMVGALGFWLLLPPPQPRVLNSTQLTKDGRGKSGTLVTDGARVYFALRGDDARFRIVHVPVTGGEPSTIPTPSLEVTMGAIINDISLDHDRLLVRLASILDESPWWEVHVTGSTPHRLSDLVAKGGGAKWSPDDKMLVYTKGSDLFVARSDGTESRRLAATRGLPAYPVWSPDGKSVRFSLLRDPRGDTVSLWEVSIAKGEPYELLSDLKRGKWGGCWTPDGKYFLFLSSGTGRTDIWAIRERHPFLGLTKQHPVQLTFGPISYYSIVAGHDGKKIFALGVQPRGAVERYDPKSGRFQPFLSGLSADCCAYSKDGKWIAYVTYPERQLWRSSVDGSERQQLTWPPMIALNPYWSPNDKEIAFTMLTPGKTWKPVIIPAEGGIPRPLRQGGESACPELDANWSPDGTRIVFAPFAGTSDYRRATCPVAVHVMDVNTGAVSALPGSEGLWAPKWSPDGERIVAINTLQTALMIYEFRTQKWSELIKHPGSDLVGFPQWSVDSRLVYYWSNGVVYRVGIEGRKVEKVASSAGIPTTGTNSGFWASVAPDGSPIILRDLSMREVYALDLEAP